MAKSERFIAGSGGFPGSGTLPSAVTMTGTVTTSGVGVVGVGTKFSTEFVAGDYLYNPTDNAIRKIIGITSDVLMQIESAFTTQLSGAPVQRARAKYVSIGIIATGAGTKDGVALASGQFISLNSDYNIEPFTYSGSVTFDTLYNS